MQTSAEREREFGQGLAAKTSLGAVAILSALLMASCSKGPEDGGKGAIAPAPAPQAQKTTEDVVNPKPDAVQAGSVDAGWDISTGTVLVNNDILQIQGSRYRILRNGEPITPDYDFIGISEEGLMQYCDKGQCGYLDDDGKVAIPAAFMWAFPFDNGAAIVMKNGGYPLLIDKTGKTIVNFNQGFVTNVSNNMMFVNRIRSNDLQFPKSEFLWSYDYEKNTDEDNAFFAVIGRSGKAKFFRGYESEYWSFIDNITYVGDYYYVDGGNWPKSVKKTGTPQGDVFDVNGKKHIFSTDDGRPWCYECKNDTCEGSLENMEMDNYIHVTINPRARAEMAAFGTLGDFPNVSFGGSKECAKNKKDKPEKYDIASYRFVNGDGDTVPLDGYKDAIFHDCFNQFVERWYDKAPIPKFLFNESRAMVNKDGFWGMIEPTGEPVTDFVWTDARFFNNGIAMVKNDKGMWGGVNSRGKEVIPFVFEDAGMAATNRIPVKKNGKWGYIDKTGATVIPFVFYKAEEFNGSWAHVKFDNGPNTYVIDINGSLTGDYRPADIDDGVKG